MKGGLSSIRRWRATRHALLLIAMGALAAAACGGSATAGGASSPTSGSSSPSATLIASVDACKLVTQAEASAAVGAQVSNVAAQNGGVTQAGGACYYGSTDFTHSVLVYGIVLPDTQSAKSMSASQMAAAVAGSSTFGQATPVRGIGDSAIEYATSGNVNTSGLAIFVLKSNVALLIAVSPLTSSATIEGLARTAVSRL